MPLFLYGHSLGALIVLSLLVCRRPAVDGAIVSAPPLRNALRTQRLKLLLARGLGGLLPRLSLPRASMPARCHGTGTSSRPTGPTRSYTTRVTLGFAHDALLATAAVEMAATVGCPLLVLHGSADRIAFPEGSRALAARLAGRRHAARVPWPVPRAAQRAGEGAVVEACSPGWTAIPAPEPVDRCVDAACPEPSAPWPIGEGSVNSRPFDRRNACASSILPSPLPCCSPAVAPAGAGDGLALTPPMGWNSWNKFACNVSEQLIKDAADALVASGMKDAGYQYIVIDDCWQVSRAADGTIVADAERFPSGIKALADYVHSKGLKFGIYSDAGTGTCQNRPGLEGPRAAGREDLRLVGRRLPEVRLVQQRGPRRSATRTRR